MSKLYPKRSYESTAEVAVGDVVRMRHTGDLHGGQSPSFDDSVISAISDDAPRFATLRRPHLYVWSDGVVDTRLESFDVDLVLLINRFDVLTNGASGEKESRLRPELYMIGYFTVLIPWSAQPTQWHPTERTGPFATLSRGAFRTANEAADWARDKLDGQPYTVRFIKGAEEGNDCTRPGD